MVNAGTRISFRRRSCGMGYHSAIGDMDSLGGYRDIMVALLALERSFYFFSFLQLYGLSYDNHDSLSS